MKHAYFDHSSTSIPKAPGVTEAITSYLNKGAYNIGRGGYAASFDIAMEILQARELLAKFFNAADPRAVIFTPSLTYAMNAILSGFLAKGDHVITTSMEHNAVMRPLHALSQQRKVTYDVAECSSDGSLNSEDILPLIRSTTKAVVMTHASNVCGTVLPIQEVANICKQHNLRLIVDAAQTAGVLPIDISSIDALAFPGHKALLGPMGIGGFIVKSDFAKQIQPTLWGGTGSLSQGFDQPDFLPDKFESGTMNIAGILGLKAAINHLLEQGIDTIYQHEIKLYRHFISSAKDIEGINLIAAENSTSETALTQTKKVPVVSVDFPRHDNAAIAATLDKHYGIMTRCGLHCAPAAHKTLGTFPQGTVRFSFGHTNTLKEVDYLLNSLKELLGTSHGV
ncbi:MAG: aminotransferase class V-fold PLP-dependent enzyme [Coriobacteriia bacterium]|nr:aminotransferase class V-fold PLP-dependent enzyme [Coriobacteriia bacterium]MCL2746093.1 aminotransferase class V-fold PLP-dependent enzyme [Coriobacteriia bacterium]MCL2870341.1 aminotransferase class V-fold PLP-dependent enzyme [Coriobacteriia bacterium]